MGKTEVVTGHIVVTGCAGFIGSHVTAELLRRGHAVRVIDNFSTGSRENLVAVGGEVELIEGDIRSYERTHAAMEGVDCVIHLAARDAGTQRVVMASSSSVYGRAQELPKTEGLVPQPISPYGVSKLAAEQYCMGLNAVYGIEVAALRYFNVFGPRQDPNSQYSGVIPRFLTQALDGAPLVVFGDGKQSRDFTYVDNVVAATLSASERRLDGPLICNVGCGTSHTVLGLAEAVGRVAERAVQIEYVPARPGDVLHSFADITVAREALGYEPTVGLEEGLERTLDWMLAERRAGSSAAWSEKR